MKPKIFEFYNLFNFHCNIDMLYLKTIILTRVLLGEKALWFKVLIKGFIV